jgi:hypothetical protein
VRQLLERLLRIVADSEDYFVSGSLSFLPLLPAYREPMHDVDASIHATLFEDRRVIVAAEGQIQILRLAEVAVAQNSPIARALSPRTDFIHVNTPDGLLDLSVYASTKSSLVFRLGGGFALHLPRDLLRRVAVLAWAGLRYRAGPPELAFLPKAVWYLGSGPAAGTTVNADLAKHLQDLIHMLPIVDWGFLDRLIRESSIRWFGRRLPTFVDRRLNPFAGLDLRSLSKQLKSAAQQANGGGGPPA